MALTPERLEEIDRELAALGKGDQELLDVLQRARVLVASLEDPDATLASLGEGREEAVARAVEAGARPEQPTPPDGVHPASAPPPDFDDEGESTDVRPAATVEAEQGAAPTSEPPPERPSERPSRQSDIAGLSVDELFADAEPSAPDASDGGGGLADLFDDEPLSLGASDEGFSSLEDELEGSASASSPTSAEAQSSPAQSTPPPLPPSQMPPPAELPVVGEEEDDEEDSTQVLSADDFADMVELGGSDEFELLVDEDVLEMDAADEPPPAGDDGEGGGEGGDGGKGGGLISRILGRK